MGSACITSGGCNQCVRGSKLFFFLLIHIADDQHTDNWEFIVFSFICNWTWQFSEEKFEIAVVNEVALEQVFFHIIQCYPASHSTSAVYFLDPEASE
jgi:hypothetical protein